MKPPKAYTRVFALLATLVALFAVAPSANHHLRAASLLMRVSDPKTTSAIANFRQYEVTESRVTVQTKHGPVPAKLFTPVVAGEAQKNAHGMVVVHGVHHLGIEEPRLVIFSRAIAANGITVLAPELPGIADYHVSKESIDVIGAAARDLRARLGKPVGVFGLSFSGGLALLAAADPQYQPEISFVVAVGAHHDMARVARYLATSDTINPAGKSFHQEANGYGALILIYLHVEDFFPPADAETARQTIRLILYEDEPAAKKMAEKLSAKSSARMDLVFGHQRAPLQAELLQSIERHRAEFAEVSPRGHLVSIKVPVLLLHGAEDAVIPPTETEWLAQELSPKIVEAELISPAISHVEVDTEPAMKDQVALVHFIAEMLEEAEKAQ